MMVDCDVYIMKRTLPKWFMRLFFIRAVIKTSSPYFPRPVGWEGPTSDRG